MKIKANISHSRGSLPFILASSSPRRISLLQQVGLKVEVISPSSDEEPLKGEGPQALVRRLAFDKAQSIKDKALKKHRRCFILAADTVVVEPQKKKILGKPESALQAFQMLDSLQGATHLVFTGYCILLVDRGRPDRKKIRVVSSRVKMRKLQKKAITEYVASGEPMDKAGSYGAQGLGSALIEKISGSYTNVVGLPITQVLQDLENDFEVPLFSWLR